MRKVLFKYRITEEKCSREQISRLISTTTDAKRFINAETYSQSGKEVILKE